MAVCILAQALCLQLGRGHWDAAAGRHLKLRGPVTFPLYLELTPLVGLAASPAVGPSADDGLAASNAQRQPRSSSSMGSIFLRTLDQVTSLSFPSKTRCRLLADMEGLRCKCGTKPAIWYAAVLTQQRKPDLPRRLSTRQVQAARGAARQAGVPEHVVTGVRLRLKSPDDAAENGHSEGNTDGIPANDVEAFSSSSGSSADGSPDRVDAAPISAAQSADPAKQIRSPPLEQGEKPLNMRSADRGPDTGHSGEGSRQLRYHLAAVVVHHGGPESGHYTTFRCEGARRQWFLTSDSDVWPVAESVVMGSKATLLLYERDTVHARQGLTQ